jgi:hypothetical protein
MPLASAPVSASTLGNAFVDVALRGDRLGDVLRSLTLSLAELTLRAAFKPLTDQIGSGLAGLLGGVAFAKGGVVPRPLPVPFAQGGVIASPVAFPLDGNGLGVAGERGAEAILPLARGPDAASASAPKARRQHHLQRVEPRRRGFQRSETSSPPCSPRRRPGPTQPVRGDGGGRQ